MCVHAHTYVFPFLFCTCTHDCGMDFTAGACKASSTQFPAVRACTSLCIIALCANLPSTARLCIVIFHSSAPTLCICEFAWESVFCSRSESLFKPMRVHYCDPSPSTLVPTLTFCAIYADIFSFGFAYICFWVIFSSIFICFYHYVNEFLVYVHNDK